MTTNRTSTPPEPHPKPNSIRARQLAGQGIPDFTARRTVTVLEPRLLATGADMQAYLKVSRLAARAILEDLRIKALPGKRYDLRDIWFALWGIRNVPEEGIEAMRAPLLTVAEVAVLTGGCARTIRRAGDSRCPEWRLPRHVDLGPRTRRYLRPLVMAAIYDLEPEPWLTPAPRKPILQSRLVVKTRLAPAEKPTNGHNRS
ncbi:hypothetical protein LOS8367_03697 [Limimaricola soesokkakensis]|uniref:Uncharacterized protein n=1 Tax=Limimaricola soesokkakensis TaxID=1343159 RepID=A0A1X7A752_9RHOB|nr:hypothetical protein [Limimaricola soesokkakensis]SLN72295.1 hypothetical protein LOS8367_03697 [Limimaricola soesokkakensis]